MRRIGISISECEDMRELGMGIMHLHDMFVESARILLMKGYELAYGGDMTHATGPYNFADILFQLAMTYGSKKEVRVFNYSAFPQYTKITTEKEAELKNTAVIIRVDPETGTNGLGIRYKLATAEQRKSLDKIFAREDEASKEIWASSLTAMRKKMTEDIQGRIVVGGRMTGFTGRYPGILEETIMTLNANITMAIDGRLGGVAKAIIEEMKGQANSLSLQFGADYVRPLMNAKVMWLRDDVAIIEGNTPLDFLRAVFTSEMISEKEKEAVHFWQSMDPSHDIVASVASSERKDQVAEHCMNLMEKIKILEINNDAEAVSFALDDLYNNLNNPLNKLVVSANGKIRYAISKDSIADFLIRNRMRTDTTLADFLNDNSGAAKDIKSNGVFTVSKTASIREVANLMRSNGCHEVFVTESGSNEDPVLGWIDESTVIRFME